MVSDRVAELLKKDRVRRAITDAGGFEFRCICGESHVFAMTEDLHIVCPKCFGALRRVQQPDQLKNS